MKVIKRGLELPIAGGPVQEIEAGKSVRRVGLRGLDYIGLKPTMLVQVGDRVKLGQGLFEDKKNPGVLFTSPAPGVVTEIRRGEKRSFLGIVVEVEGGDSVHFETGKGFELSSREKVVNLLTSSGAWTSLRTRPYGKIPNPATSPSSIFVTAMDTNPLAANPVVVLDGRQEAFEVGLKALTALSKKVFLCRGPRARIPGDNISGVQVEEFAGVHPAGLPGTHIHFLDPVGANKTVWYINYQDVAAIGSLIMHGRVDPRRVISLAGPSIKDPRLIETRLGADLIDLASGELKEGNHRLISGSVLCGRTVSSSDEFLGRYHLQVSALEEGNQREFLGWQKPGLDKFSITRVFAASWLSRPRIRMTTSTEGSERAMVPIGTYEKVMPLDMLPTQLLRSLIIKDTENAQLLGALELEEEDLALCTVVCPGKYDYGSILRDNLTRIEAEG